MNDLILKRCKYCDKQYTGTSESTCCSDACQNKYLKYINLRKKIKTPITFIYIPLWIIFLLSLFIYPDSPLTMHYSFIFLLIISTLEIIFPFGEDIGLKKRGVKKTKILIRVLWSVVLLYYTIIYFKAFLELPL